MKFQLVLQFRATDMRDFDDLVALEEDLIRNLSPTSQVDGHDFGVGEFNIFVLTDKPEETFNAAQKVITQRGLDEEFRAAYRQTATDKDKFAILWPRDLQAFEIA